jgi:hypothetical protein
MYFLNDNIDVDILIKQPKVEFYEFDRVYNFLELGRLHEKNLLEYKHWSTLETGAKLRFIYDLSDLAASIVRDIYKSKYLKSEIIENALEYCEQTVIDMGYFRISLEDLKCFGQEKNNALLVVAGCQSREILKHRAKTAAFITVNCNRNLKIVFSGLTPPCSDKTPIVNEARELRKYFDYYLEEFLRTKKYDYKINKQLEDESHDTIENIKQLFARGFLLEYERESNDLYVVSSSFHLTRIAQALSNASKREENSSSRINKVVLIGAERSFNPEDVALSETYVKQLFFELYKNILSRHLRINLDEEIHRKKYRVIQD